MKYTGIVRRIDSLGRIVLPIELRRTMNIDIDDPIEIFCDQGRIILKKYSSVAACLFCGNVDKVSSFKNKLICATCLNDLKTPSIN